MLTMKWLLFVIYVGGSGVPQVEVVSHDHATHKECMEMAAELSRTAPNGRFDCTWYRVRQ